ncbi:hypothetical protein ELI_02195 [Erythrobacter litoralis HTCC2594]|uniref:Uncharacterized protein n=1 Tax=Erythrobacter litoralis (strain HTCC2594) TaxID=314225 RepID=Q2NCR0_ERYLH|nr:hypothetical protein ELI_02195 [Erythrobacter litoralis HTCC2594]
MSEAKLTRSVDGCTFLLFRVRQKEEQGFDKLSPNG